MGAVRRQLIGQLFCSSGSAQIADWDVGNGVHDDAATASACNDGREEVRLYA
jgi:hypothetical protein